LRPGRWQSTIASGCAPWSRPGGSEALDGARDEIGDDGVHRNALAGDQDAGLPCRPEVRREAALAQGRGQRQGRVHLAHRAVRADGEQPVPGAFVAASDGEVGGRLAHVEQLEAALGRQRRQPGLVAQPLVEAGRDVQAGLEGQGRILDEVAAEPAPRARDPKHQRPRPRSDRLRGGKTRKSQGERAIVVAELADAVGRPEGGETSRRLDPNRIGAPAEIEEIGTRDHPPNLSP
jgi:hypothetical protein